MPLIIPSNSISDGGYVVDNSLRFDDGSSDHLSRTPSSASNRKTFTFSAWVKRCNESGANVIFQQGSDTANRFALNFQNEKLRWRGLTGGSNEAYLQTNRAFRDPSAWYHIVARFDSTNATAGDRMRLYVNGVEETDFGTDINPSLNYESFVNTTNPIDIGRDNASNTSFFDGYMAEVCLIDGQSLDPTSFGEFDEDSGIWKPIDVSGLTFGTNGFYLDFENSGSLGADVSGNGNDFTVNNLTAIDQSTDTCTNDFATLNTLDKNISNITLSDGNLTMTTSATNYGVRATMGVVSGKWYWEVKVVNKATLPLIGIAKSDWNLTYPGNTSTSIGYASNGEIYSAGNNEGPYGATYTTGDIIGVALDMDSTALTFYKNGVSQGVVSSVFTASDFIFPAFSGQGSDVLSANFGNPTFTGTDQSDGNSRGSFEYAPSSGFLSLCTANLSEVLG